MVSRRRFFLFSIINIWSLGKHTRLSFKDQLILKHTSCIKWDCYMVCSDYSAENVISFASGPVRGGWVFLEILSVLQQATCNLSFILKNEKDPLQRSRWVLWHIVFFYLTLVGEADALWSDRCCSSWLAGLLSECKDQ